MKKLTILLALILAVTMTGCAQQAQEEEPITTVAIYEIFVEAGLPVGEYIDYTEETDPNSMMNKPGQYIGKLNFAVDGLMQILDTPKGGSIEIFSSKKDAEARKEYIDQFGAASPLLAETSEIVLDKVLIRLDREVTMSEAQKYFDLFKED